MLTDSNALASARVIYTNMPDNFKLLDTGQFSGQECPDCGQRTASVNVTPYSSVYYCHRASCNARGATFGMNQGGIPRMPVKPPELIPTATYLDGEGWYRLTCHYPWLASQTFSREIQTTMDHKEVMLAVFGPDNGWRGVMERSFPGISPKRVKLWVMSRPFVAASWYGLSNGGSYVFVVEDQFSAMRLADNGHTAVALLGTDVDPDKAREIRSVADRRQIVVCLDCDATSKAYKLAPLLGAALVAPLTDDVKDMSTEDFQAFIDSYKSRD